MAVMTTAEENHTHACSSTVRYSETSQPTLRHAVCSTTTLTYLCTRSTTVSGPLLATVNGAPRCTNKESLRLHPLPYCECHQGKEHMTRSSSTCRRSRRIILHIRLDMLRPAKPRRKTAQPARTTAYPGCFYRQYQLSVL